MSAAMRLLILTSNARRHRFVANSLSRHAEEALVISECQPIAPAGGAGASPMSAAILDHFAQREATEQDWFAAHTAFALPTLPMLYGELQAGAVVRAISEFRPTACVVFGASLVRQAVLSILPPGRTINLHLGLAPYYRGSGTNFWPFVRRELSYVGSTLLHLDAGIDTGPILAHVRPRFVVGDTVHTVGCRLIEASAAALGQVIEALKSGIELPAVPQWPVADAKLYRERDFTEDAVATYLRQLQERLVEEHLERPSTPPRLILLEEALHALGRTGR